jgi:hypothetical protein
MFDPDEQWIFNFNDIPTNHNVSDYYLRAIELVKSLNRVAPRPLKTLNLVYTEATKVRETQRYGGRLFLDL